MARVELPLRRRHVTIALRRRLLRSVPAMDARFSSLRGVRVLDFTQNLPGPYATHILAQLGADVLKVESPKGDLTRAMPTLFARLNGGKRSLVADLKQPSDVERVVALADAADIIVEGFRPGVLAQYGLDAASCVARNRKVVYCSISGYGQAGPYRDRPSHDLNLQAVSGFCDFERDEHGVPRASVLPIADLSTGLTAAVLMMAGVLEQRATGEGRVIDVALVDTLSAWVSLWNDGVKLQTPTAADAKKVLGRASWARRWLGALEGDARRNTADRLFSRAVAAAVRTDWVQELKRRRLYALPHYNLFSTRDRTLAMGVLDEQRFWNATARGLGLGRLADLSVWARLALRTPLSALLQMRLAQRSAADWLRALDPNRVPVSPVVPADEVAEDPHLGPRLQELPFLATGRLAPAPALGEHTDAAWRSAETAVS